MAINMAQRAGVDPAQMNIILRKYGDHLYHKGDYDTAMQMYLKAIDNTEPSQVIRKVTLAKMHLLNQIQFLHITVSRLAKNPQPHRVSGRAA